MVEFGFGQKVHSTLEKVPIIIILIIVTYVVCLNAEFYGSRIRRHPKDEHQGSESTTTSATTLPPLISTKEFIVNSPSLIPRNFTSVSIPPPPISSSNSNNNFYHNSPYPTSNFYNDSNNPLKSRFKKKGLVFTLSLRPKERVYKPKSTVIKDGPGPTTSSSSTSSTSKSPPVSLLNHSFSSKISDLTHATFGDNRNNLNANVTKTKSQLVLDNLKKLKAGGAKSATTKSHSAASLTRGTNYGFKSSLQNSNNLTTNDERLGKIISTTTPMTIIIDSTRPSSTATDDSSRTKNNDTVYVYSTTEFMLGSLISESEKDGESNKIPAIGGYITTQELSTLSKQQQNKKKDLEIKIDSDFYTTEGSSLSPSTTTTTTKTTSTSTSKAEVFLVDGGGAKSSNQKNTTSGDGGNNNGTSSDDIEREETRYAITADQIGGNRPTDRPFHFTTTIPTSTTTQENKRFTSINVNRFNSKQPYYSPHNHIYAPTQNPIHIAHNEEELSPEDIQRFKDAHSSFGFKVDAPPSSISSSNGIGTLPTPPSSLSLLTAELADTATKPSVVSIERGRFIPRGGRNRPSSLSPATKTFDDNNPSTNSIIKKQPESASSGRNSHIKATTNLDSDANLPFYKEPGGVFVHKYSENDPEPNEVNPRINDDDDDEDEDERRAPGVKYAPKGPATEAQNQQQITYKNHHRPNSPTSYNQHQPHHHQPNQHLTRIPAPSPQYTPSPVYLAPPPVQQPVPHQHHPVSYSPSVSAYPMQHPPQQVQHQPHYYQVQSPQPAPVAYYNPPPPPAQQIPLQNHLGGFGQPHHHQQQQHRQPHPHQPLYNRLPPTNNLPHARPLQPPPARPSAVPAHSYNAPPSTPPSPQYHFYSPELATLDTDDESRKKKGAYNNPPPKYDPANDYYYGDPRPPKPSASPSPSGSSKKSHRKKPVVQEAQEEEEAEEEEEEAPAPTQEDDEQEEERHVKRKKNDKYDDGRSRGRNSNNYPREQQKQQQPQRERPPQRPQQQRPNNNYNNNYNNNGNRRPNDNNNNNNNYRNNEDYDTYPNENVGEFIRPHGLPQRPPNNYRDNRPNANVGEFTRPEGSPHRQNYDPEFVSLTNNNFDGDGDGGGEGNGRPPQQKFRPTQDDHSNRFRASPYDDGPRFNHPNIEYPQNSNNRDNRRGQRPSEYRTINNNQRDPISLPPLDPIYTRTLKQYDEENQAPRLSENFEKVNEKEQYPNDFDDNENNDNHHHNNEQDENHDRRPAAPRRQHNRNNNNRQSNNRNRHRNNDDDDDRQENEEEEEPVEERKPARSRRPQQRRPVKEQEEEEEEEEEEPEENEQKPQRRRKNNKEEEEEPEEEEEEEEAEEQKPQRKKASKDDEEEEEEEAPAEEEEEEEEEPEEDNKGKGNKRKQETKKPPPKKPQQEKPAGNLDDDINGIEREFGVNSGYDPYGVQQQVAPQQIHPAFQG